MVIHFITHPEVVIDPAVPSTMIGAARVSPSPNAEPAKTLLEAQTAIPFYTLQAYMSSVEFEWDPDKSSANYTSRGFDFAFATAIFAGPTIEFVDIRHNYGEVRIRAIGETAGMALVVIYTDRDDMRRIISARAANRKERAQWLNLSA